MIVRIDSKFTPLWSKLAISWIEERPKRILWESVVKNVAFAKLVHFPPGASGVRIFSQEGHCETLGILPSSKFFEVTASIFFATIWS
jgi:hypothetical protein